MSDSGISVALAEEKCGDNISNTTFAEIFTDAGASRVCTNNECAITADIEARKISFRNPAAAT